MNMRLRHLDRLYLLYYVIFYTWSVPDDLINVVGDGSLKYDLLNKQ